MDNEEKPLNEGLLSDEELKRKLASGEYSISPRSGRLRRRIRVKGKKPLYSKRKMKKMTRKLLWILLLVGFILTLIIIAPEINVAPKKPDLRNVRK
jgi:hypothetical protein